MSGKWHREPLAVQPLKLETCQGVGRPTWSPTDMEFQMEPPLQNAAIKRVEKSAWNITDAQYEKESDPQPDNMMRDPDIATHAVLRKHYKYLLPWLSSQPKPRPDSENIEAEALSYKQMTNEFRQLSLLHFMDLSWSIYHDVRRREQAALFESASRRLYPEFWTKTKHNESKMALCRILNDHFYRLITAVVLEQARRLSDLRVSIYRSGILTKA